MFDTEPILGRHRSIYEVDSSTTPDDYKPRHRAEADEEEQ